MKPIRIFRHVSCEGPGYLGQFLDRRLNRVADRIYGSWLQPVLSRTN